MDGASVVITFVLVALKSVKAVHGTLSALKDGPHNLTNVIHSVEEIRSILERLQNILGSGTHDDADLLAFSNLADQCANDVKRFDERLGRLTVSTDNKSKKIFWKRMKTALDEKELDRMRNILQGHTSSIALRIITLQVVQTSASVPQISQIHGMVETLGDRLSRLAHQDHSLVTSSSDEAMATATMQAEMKQKNDIESSISRLCDLIQEEGHTRDTEDAEQLIEDLKIILDAAFDIEARQNKARDVIGQPDQGNEYPGSSLVKDIRLVSNIICSAPFISVNCKECNDPTIFGPLEIIADQQRKRKSIDVGKSTLTITANRRLRKTIPVQGQNNHDNSNVSEKDFFMKIAVRPKGSSRMFVLRVDQSNSPVFRVAVDGNVQDLTRLLAQGSANVRDHDENGWSLLHIWMLYANILSKTV
ncbi:hypothetical protein BU23DRAFT_642668 [Bimuria novae-zelandiae CBS 107.79]|uniref:Azaphilone pigments biosynthesis cluster protein L N-terminal domain-containing protein n=1 Tax=Bimuria novae-zelandiae CBS 107.79 TaxID=1447943 RepID=A0A6A5VR74_9PLEO|nr:hypothetical protein BU23DRAFT_642668 [Bimuria novae-zelandiae CBS 107.79]